jgi:pimeloyl-ACP methyl ester carboxylesterase
MDYPSLAEDLKVNLGDSKKVVLVGHSMGGKAGITFACKWPHLVKGVISIDAPPINRNQWPELNHSTITMIKRALSLGDISQ